MKEEGGRGEKGGRAGYASGRNLALPGRWWTHKEKNHRGWRQEALFRSQGFDQKPSDACPQPDCSGFWTPQRKAEWTGLQLKSSILKKHQNQLCRRRPRGTLHPGVERAGANEARVVVQTHRKAKLNSDKEALWPSRRQISQPAASQPSLWSGEGETHRERAQLSLCLLPRKAQGPPPQHGVRGVLLRLSLICLPSQTSQHHIGS